MRQVKKALKEQQKQQKQQQKRPKKDCPQGKASSTVTFSEEELVKFAQRYENGYDITTDDQYNAWLQILHPTEGKTSVPCKLYKHVQMCASMLAGRSLARENLSGESLTRKSRTK